MTKQETCNKYSKTISDNKSFCDKRWSAPLESPNPQNLSDTNPNTEPPLNTPSIEPPTYLDQQKSKYGTFSYLFLMNKGRISRSTYTYSSFCILFIFLILAASIYSIVDSSHHSIYYDPNYHYRQMINTIKILTYMSLFILAFGYFQLMLTAKRLHDLNLSAGFIVIPYALSTIPVLNILVLIGYNLYLILAPGTEGENNFGPNPKAKVEPQIPELAA